MYCTLYRRQWAMILHCPGVKTPIAISVVIMRQCSSKVIRVMLGMIRWRWSLFVAIVIINGWLELNGICGTRDARVWGNQLLGTISAEKWRGNYTEGGRLLLDTSGSFCEGAIWAVWGIASLVVVNAQCASSCHSASFSTCRMWLLHNSSSSNKYGHSFRYYCT